MARRAVATAASARRCRFTCSFRVVRSCEHLCNSMGEIARTRKAHDGARGERKPCAPPRRLRALASPRRAPGPLAAHHRRASTARLAQGLHRQHSSPTVLPPAPRTPLSAATSAFLLGQPRRLSSSSRLCVKDPHEQLGRLPEYTSRASRCVRLSAGCEEGLARWADETSTRSRGRASHGGARAGTEMLSSYSCEASAAAQPGSRGRGGPGPPPGGAVMRSHSPSVPACAGV